MIDLYNFCMKTSKYILAVAFIFLVNVVFSQNTDMTGTWEAVGEENYGDAEIKLIQTGETIIGECYYPKTGLKGKISATMIGQNQVVGVEKFQSGVNNEFRWNVKGNSFQGVISHEKKQNKTAVKGSKKSSSIPVFSYL
jgi:hypothetical protein